jgi:ribosomal protein L7/L12
MWMALMMLLIFLGRDTVTDAVDDPSAWNVSIAAVWILAVVVYAATTVYQWRTRHRQDPEKCTGPVEVSDDAVAHSIASTPNRIAAIKTLREHHPGLGLREAAELIDTAPPHRIHRPPRAHSGEHVGALGYTTHQGHHIKATGRDTDSVRAVLTRKGTQMTFFADTAFAMPLPVTISIAGVAIWVVIQLAANDPSWLGTVARILFVVGGIALIVTVAVAAASFMAVCLTVAAVLFFMAPLFAAGGASGVADRRPRRGYYRDPYRRDPYGNDYC